MNEVAEKIELKVEEGFDISLIPGDKLTLVWDQCEKFLEKSCKRSNGRVTTRDVFYDCLNNKASLWIIFDKSNLYITGCAITKINEYPTGKRMLNIDHVTGKKMDEWIDRIEVLYSWGKANNCKGIEGVGREGFWNWIKQRENWKKTAIFFEYEFEDTK
tara:strand:+ start:362 stop:838 length:477 start_codon:yes stop_codon:yes gene_type:complete